MLRVPSPHQQAMTRPAKGCPPGNLASGRVFPFMGLLGFWSCLAILSACSGKQTTENQIPVARVGTSILSLSEITRMIPDQISKEDSIITAKAYINNWIIKQLKLQRAQLNLPIQKKLDIEARVEDYRSTLQIYEYEQQFVREKMDTVIQPAAISDYYTKNPDGFILQKNIVKGYYIQVPRTAPDLPDLRRWLKSRNSRFDDDIGKYVATFATNHQSFEKDFIYFDDILNRIPQSFPNQNAFLRENNLIELEDSLSVHFISITEFKLQGTLAPLGLVYNDIRKILLNRRQVDLVRRLDQDIFNEANEDGSFDIFQE